MDHFPSGAPTPAIRLTDEFLRMQEGLQFANLPAEVEARWRLVETAWSLGLPRGVIVGVDAHAEFLEVLADARRPVLTGVRDALNGYQKGRCFYCFDHISIAASAPNVADVDHVFPRALLQYGLGLPLDGIWNLVLACRDCNRGPAGKFARLASAPLMQRLDTRNEFLISSHHPLRETLMAHTGQSRSERIQFLTTGHRRGQEFLVHTWEARPKYAPAF